MDENGYDKSNPRIDISMIFHINGNIHLSEHLLESSTSIFMYLILIYVLFFLNDNLIGHLNCQWNSQNCLNTSIYNNNERHMSFAE